MATSLLSLEFLLSQQQRLGGGWGWGRGGKGGAEEGVGVGVGGGGGGALWWSVYIISQLGSRTPNFSEVTFLSNLFCS